MPLQALQREGAARPPVASVVAAATSGSGSPAGSAAGTTDGSEVAAACRTKAVLEASCSSSWGSASACTAAGRRRRPRCRRDGSSATACGCRPALQGAPPSSCRCCAAASVLAMLRGRVGTATPCTRQQHTSSGQGRAADAGSGGADSGGGFAARRQSAPQRWPLRIMARLSLHAGGRGSGGRPCRRGSASGGKQRATRTGRRCQLRLLQ